MFGRVSFRGGGGGATIIFSNSSTGLVVIESQWKGKDDRQSL